MKSQSLSGWDGVFHRLSENTYICDNSYVAIPFRVGWGFSLDGLVMKWEGGKVPVSQSLSGWDGVFHLITMSEEVADVISGRNPFQGGMGFFTAMQLMEEVQCTSRNPFQGGMGFFTLPGVYRLNDGVDRVAIPFRVGWGFSLEVGSKRTQSFFVVAIPFRVGWGFSLQVVERIGQPDIMSQSLSGWDGVFHRRDGNLLVKKAYVAIPFRVGWGFSQDYLGERLLLAHGPSQSLSGWDGVFHRKEGKMVELAKLESQSLSGWDGVFHRFQNLATLVEYLRSQSLSGWDGVFHLIIEAEPGGADYVSQSLSGWDGVFHQVFPVETEVSAREVAIPFRVGWGFSLRFP